MKKRILPLFLGFFIYIFLITNFIYFLSTTENAEFVPSSFFSKYYETDYSNDLTSDVGTFITDSTEDIEQSILHFMQDVFTIRNDAFLNGNVEKLYKFYDINQTFSSYSLEHEFKRIAFLRNWANKRSISFKNIESTPTIKSLKIKDGYYNLILSEEYKFNYYYDNNPDELNTFGIQLIHNLELKDTGDSFIISKDYYEDYFKSGLEEYDFNLTEKNIDINNLKPKLFNFNVERNPLSNGEYNIQSAINYANKYSGISFASKEKFNSNYFTYIAGDGNSANFISQTLSDTLEGGGLSQDRMWFYKNTKSTRIKATSSWVKSEDLVNYLLNTNKFSITLSGNIEEILYNNTTSNKKINIGDLVVFKKGNYIESIGIITDFDANNYPLINSNSINTFKAPFDLGFEGDDFKCYILSAN
ncbi:amidase domain-containing protein [Clostridium sp. AL.422]|uniref:amidase domain-containing protein n=1 Tax=Clostridium TaxID=1485 RepID=UPI00293DEC0F|nr:MULTISPECIES: amidase domain-containing protein [unclassified Clostridium]MDV4152406.1 amidase domain-containing protein [Clostridium sp. AL.422]